MSRTRPAAILLVTVALFCTTSVAWAASSRLTPTPPVALPQGPTTPAPTTSAPVTPAPTTSASATPASAHTATTAAGPSGTIARTGQDLPRELLVALLLLAAGATLRTRPRADRR